MRRPLQRRLAAPVLLSLVLATAAGAALPDEDECPTLSGLPGASGKARDAAPVRIKEGMLLSHADILLLGSLIPVEVWRNRDAFFHDGMRMEIGPCHRRYPVPGFYERATRKFAGRAKVDEDGNLLNYIAGLPFPPETIDPKDPDAGVRWAWNAVFRYQGAGPAGRFRILDLAARVGGDQIYEGEWFLLQTDHRADLWKSDYAVPEVEHITWAAGGEFAEPLAARYLAWRQLRPTETVRDFSKPDDTFVYVPTMRKVRRAATAWVDGIYMPRYRVSGDSGGGGLPVGGDFSGGSINPTAATSIAATEGLERGFTGLTLRPNAYVWRVLTEREVLAPINITREGYPIEPDRNYGPSGLSVGSDRWDVRYAVVLQGLLKERGRGYDTITLYLDYQTQQPLFVITKLKRGGRLVEVGVLLHRFSGDNPHYPKWPSGEDADVFDPVAQVSYHAADGGSGWRRESYDITSLPRSEVDTRRMTSPAFLTRGR
jgi:hypothetical protein